MLSIIKTAIITIIISFISGVLLDYYKNFGSKIVCSLKRMKLNSASKEGLKLYSVSIKNVSRKTIHDLNLNVQTKCRNIKIDDAKITKGLKFDIENVENFYDIAIPFLSKNDEFKALIYLEDVDDSKVKPVLALRSPEKFKKVYKFNNKEVEQDNNEKLQNNFILKNIDKKKIIAGVILFAIVFGLVSIGEHFINSTSKPADLLPKSADTQKNSADTSNSSASQPASKTNTEAGSSESVNKSEPADNKAKAYSSDNASQSASKAVNNDASKNNNTENNNKNNSDKKEAEPSATKNASADNSNSAAAKDTTAASNNASQK